MDFNLKTLEAQLSKLAMERNNQYPLKFYARREKFMRKLDEFAALIIQETKNFKIDEKIISQVKKFRQKPVFICGFYKSGTSLLNSLLDYHPETVTLLPDTKLLIRIYPQTIKLARKNFFTYLAKQYLIQLYSPTGHLPMNLYSQSLEKIEIKNYIRFAAYLKYFIQKAENKAQLLSALPAAIYISNGQFDRGDKIKLWIEKTPTNEHFITRAKKLFPEAKFIFILRNPYDNMASAKKWRENAWKRKFDFYKTLNDLKKTFRKANKLKNKTNIYFLRYEDLVQNPTGEMQKICHFLNINYNPQLTQPTIMNKADRPNVSDAQAKKENNYGKIITSRINKYKQTLSAKEIKYISIELGKLMEQLGFNKHRKTKMNYGNYIKEWIYLKLMIFYQSKLKYNKLLRIIKAQILKIK